MLVGTKHRPHVERLMGRLPEHATAEQLVAAFQQSVTALWQRAALPLGSITLTAIVDRVLHDGSTTHPLLAMLDIDDETGVRFDKLRNKVTAQDAQQVRDGMSDFLLRFLTVVGNLTGDILTPALHARLDDVTPGAVAGELPTSTRPSDRLSNAEEQPS
jgi:hypothetical protein